MSRARRTVENTFGILVSKWRILERPIIANLETIEKIVSAFVCLHNFLKRLDLQKPDKNRYCPTTYVDREAESGEIIEGDWKKGINNGLNEAGRMGGNAYARHASTVRSILTDYFMNISPIENQWLK